MTKIILFGGEKSDGRLDQLKTAFLRQKADVCHLDVGKMRLSLGHDRFPEYAKGCDGAIIQNIPHGSLEQIIYRMDALYMLERRGIVFLNSPKVIEKTVDKFYTSTLLAEHGLPVPPTFVAEAAPEALEAYERLGRDVLYKPLFGSGGRGIVRLRDEKNAEAALTKIVRRGSVLYIQKFIDCHGEDIRAFVVGGKVIAAMRRIGATWRANCSRGGRPKRYRLKEYEEELACKAASAVGADLAGVDLLPAASGEVYISEVNGCPGWKGLSSVTNADIPRAIAESLLPKIALAGRQETGYSFRSACCPANGPILKRRTENE